jgi:signal transduction histidine kinase
LASDPKFSSKCDKDHRLRGLTTHIKDPHICHAGLFNISFPIKINNDVIASILVGQRKISGREKESENQFNKFLENSSISSRDKENLSRLFKEVDTIEERDFKDLTQKHLPFVHNLLNQILEQEQYTRSNVDSLAHELLLPLQSLIILAENMRDESYADIIDREFIRESSARVLFEISKLGFYAKNIRKYMQLFTIKTDYDFRDIFIYQLIDQASKRFTIEAEDKGVIIKPPSYTGGHFPKLNVVEDELSIALNNLYSNAIKYSFSSQKGDRYITTECDAVNEKGKSYFTISISNFGVGILQEEIDSQIIFSPGYRGFFSKDRNRTGSGVGLYLTKEIIERIHKGKIKIQSVDIKGAYLTTVTILLPFSREG